MATLDNPGLVFGRRSLRMPTSDAVEVLRETAGPGQRRLYSKRFLVGPAGDLSAWTARERQILERLGRVEGAPVAELLPVPAPAGAGLHTFDAGPTVDQWATRVLLSRNGSPIGNPFEECAGWWALARRCLVALDKLHAIGFVHLDLKADNVCIPWSQSNEGGSPVPGQPLTLRMDELALIDVAFSLLPGVPLPGPLPLDREPEYEYQSQRLLDALEQGRRGNSNAASALDWRCDLFSLGAMLWRYLPKIERSAGSGWTPNRHAQATAFVRLLVDADAGPLAAQRPHAELIVLTEWRLREPELAAALKAGYTFEAERAVPIDHPTPLTRIFRPAGATAAVAAPAPTVPVDASIDTPPIASEPVDILLEELSPAGPASVDLLLPDWQPVQAPPNRMGGLLSTPVDPTWFDMPPADVGAPEVPWLDTTPTSQRLGPLAPDSAQAEPAVAPAPTPPAASDPWQPDIGLPLSDHRPPSTGPRRSHVGRALMAAAAVLGAVAAVAWWGDRSSRPAVPERGPALAAAPSSAPVASSREPEPASKGSANAVPTPSVAPSPSDASSASIGSDVAILPNLPRRRPGEPPVEIFLPPTPRPASRTPAPPASMGRQERLAGDFDDVGRQLMQGAIPRLAASAERQLAPALSTAGRANDAAAASEVRAAARAARQSAGPATTLPVVVATQQARRLNEAARVAYWQRNNVPDAVELQTKALGANPFDTEVVGNLAFLRLRENPPQAESARTLALHALTLKDSRFPAGRVEDWTTLAIANALTGHEADARNAWFVTMAISNDLERHCKAAVRAQAIYGEKLRSSVQSMLERARSSPGYSRCGDRPERTSRGSARPRSDSVSAAQQDPELASLVVGV